MNLPVTEIKNEIIKKKRKKPKKYNVVESEDRYIVVSFTMTDIADCDIPVFKIKDLKKGVYINKTGMEIICQPEIAFNLSKKDLLQVSFFAGQSSTIFRNTTIH